MSLEDLVPPLELCRKIPEGKFDGSALVWHSLLDKEWKYNYIVISRECSCCCDAVDTGHIIAPAPTIQEIIPAIVEAGGFHPEIMYKPDDEGNGGHWEVECFTKEDPDTVEDFTIGSPLETDSINPATAALKLWLMLAVEDRK